MAGVDVDTLTMEQYLALSRENQAPVMLRVFPSLLPDPQRDEWTDSPQELSILGISSKRPLSKGYAKFAKDLASTRIIPSTRKLNKLKRSDIENLDEQRLLTGTMEGSFRVDQLDTTLTLENHLSYGRKESLLSKQSRGTSRISDTPEVLQHQLPPKELNPGSFTLPCTIGKFNFYAMADLDMSKITPLGIVENIIVKIDKFIFPSDFVIIDNTPSETTILERPFLATIHAEIDVFAGKFSLGINEERISFDMMRKYHPNDSAIINNPTHRSFDDHKWEFNLEIDKLADEYEIGIWEKGYILDNIWEYCNQVHNDNNGWHNHEFKNEEREEMGIEDEDYHPPISTMKLSA
ncbi:hypothetical protein Tco_0363918 [Tanacetum coccineum]